jgi:hypothetical protein
VMARGNSLIASPVARPAATAEQNFRMHGQLM